MCPYIIPLPQLLHFIAISRYDIILTLNSQSMDIFFTIIIGLVILIFSSILHEIAHGYVAYRLGDPTAKLLGRLTLNPKNHIDPYMSIVLPIITYVVSGGRFIFGGAKPVPIDPFNLRDGIKDLAIVSVAGPLTNVLIVVICSILIHIVYPSFLFDEVAGSGLGGFILSQIVYLNLLLGIFNLVPIPPLDGSKVLAMFLPPRQAASFLSTRSLGFIFLIAFFYLGGSSFLASLINFAIHLLGL